LQFALLSCRKSVTGCHLLDTLQRGRHEDVVDAVLSVLGERLKDVLREALIDLITKIIKAAIIIIDPLGAIALKVCQLLGACP
jgi:hypothetical protein